MALAVTLVNWVTGDTYTLTLLGIRNRGNKGLMFFLTIAEKIVISITLKIMQTQFLRKKIVQHLM